MSSERFANVDESDLKNLIEKKDSKSTKRVRDRSVSLFREFLPHDEREFESFTCQKLNEKLRLFYASIRQKNGEKLKTSSLQSIKYGISKYMKEVCKVDIHTNPEFSSSQAVYKAVMVDLKKRGFGGVEHKDALSVGDIKKLYDPDSVVFNPNMPCGLQMKVWYELMYFLCRRGRENLRNMKKSTFAIETDASGLEYVYQVKDEADKNHKLDTKPDDTTGEARMYARPNDTMCPVKSFKKYLGKLHPDLQDLWQRPLDEFNDSDEVWYCKAPLGKNTLSTMMSNISKVGKLSKIYTNHCVRATSITALDDAGIEARHIMRASGHKNEASIRSYSCRLSESKKRQMSACLSSVLGAPQDVHEINVPVSHENESNLLSLTQDELNNIFSAENSFQEIENFPPQNIPQQNTMNVKSNIVNEHRDHGNIYPTITNCVVNFNFKY